MSMEGEVLEAVLQWIRTNAVSGASPGELTASTALLTSGHLDSLSTLNLAQYLEER